MYDSDLFNMWDFLIKGFLVMVATTINIWLPPATTQTTLDNAQNFSWFFGQAAWVIFSLVWSSLSLFNWTIVIGVMGYNLLLFAIQLILSIWFFIKRIFLVD